jgi:hypothetical protein
LRGRIQSIVEEPIGQGSWKVAANPTRRRRIPRRPTVCALSALSLSTPRRRSIHRRTRSTDESVLDTSSIQSNLSMRQVTGHVDTRVPPKSRPAGWIATSCCRSRLARTRGTICSTSGPRATDEVTSHVRIRFFVLRSKSHPNAASALTQAAPTGQLRRLGHTRARSGRRGGNACQRRQERTPHLSARCCSHSGRRSSLRRSIGPTAWRVFLHLPDVRIWTSPSHTHLPSSLYTSLRDGSKRDSRRMPPRWTCDARPRTCMSTCQRCETIRLSALAVRPLLDHATGSFLGQT